MTIRDCEMHPAILYCHQLSLKLCIIVWKYIRSQYHKMWIFLQRKDQFIKRSFRDRLDYGCLTKVSDHRTFVATLLILMLFSLLSMSTPIFFRNKRKQVFAIPVPLFPVTSIVSPIRNTNGSQSSSVKRPRLLIFSS